MTRCKAFYKKMKALRIDRDAAAEFCEKESRAVQQIYAHIDFMDGILPDWLDDADKSNGRTIVRLSEGATRPLRFLSRDAPEIVSRVIERVCQLEDPTASEVRNIICEERFPRSTDEITTQANISAFLRSIAELEGYREQIRDAYDVIGTGNSQWNHFSVDIEGNVKYDLSLLQDKESSFQAWTQAESLVQYLLDLTPEGEARKVEEALSRVNAKMDNLKHAWCMVYGTLRVNLLCEPSYEEEDRAFFDHDHTVEELMEYFDDVRERSIDVYRELLREKQDILEKELGAEVEKFQSYEGAIPKETEDLPHHADIETAIRRLFFMPNFVLQNIDDMKGELRPQFSGDAVEQAVAELVRKGILERVCSGNYRRIV